VSVPPGSSVTRAGMTSTDASDPPAGATGSSSLQAAAMISPTPSAKTPSDRAATLAPRATWTARPARDVSGRRQRGARRCMNTGVAMRRTVRRRRRSRPSVRKVGVGRTASAPSAVQSPSETRLPLCQHLDDPTRMVGAPLHLRLRRAEVAHRGDRGCRDLAQVLDRPGTEARVVDVDD